MATPSKDIVIRVHLTEGVQVPGRMVSSLDEKTDKVAMSLHPAGVLVVDEKGRSVILPYARCKSIFLG